MSDAATTTPPDDSATLRAGAIGFVDALVIGLAATSPAYSLAAVIAPIVLLVGVAAPGVLLASFVPMLLIASAFYFLNKVDQDCGTTFSWVTRAMGPWFGWLGGWAIAMTGVLVIGSLAEVGVLFSLYAARPGRRWPRTPWWCGCWRWLLILLMTWLCVLGTEMSARLQNVLILAQVAALLVFAGVALWRATQRRQLARGGHAVAVVAEPVRRRRRRADRRAAARGVRVLGLGVGGQPHRGDRGLRLHARAGPASSRP